MKEEIKANVATPEKGVVTPKKKEKKIVRIGSLFEKADKPKCFGNIANEKECRKCWHHVKCKGVK